eukprot:108197-Rhodomonas_salina.1
MSCYAVSGTDTAYAARPALRDVRYRRRLCCYAMSGTDVGYDARRHGAPGGGSSLPAQPRQALRRRSLPGC